VLLDDGGDQAGRVALETGGDGRVEIGRGARWHGSIVPNRG
jgi:hypothetical protein